ncbi:chloride channel protein [Hugenholtzia roseola]|uniref:chloride channel protein n=1 Tax=Hugenholtzia roseola TaxID=1002 RepID=UPI0003FA3D7E|nr:chloride channel protein [Hugenholtzia roseola]
MKNIAEKLFFYLFKWLFLALLIGFLMGFSGAFFLYALESVELYRTQQPLLLLFLPIGGLLISMLYHHWGREVEKGNNLIIEQIQNPTQEISLKMAFLVLMGTLCTHLFGGSAGREGTAVQMGSSIADQFSFLLKYLKKRFVAFQNHIEYQKDRRTLLRMGTAAGFAAVFGTPLAGTVFALEVVKRNHIDTKAAFPTILASFFAYYFAQFFCHQWQVAHSIYPFLKVAEFTLNHFLICLLVGFLCGIVAFVFIHFTDLIKNILQKINSKIVLKNGKSYPPLRTFIGGVVFIAFVSLFFPYWDTRYLGLGVPLILGAFESPSLPYDFMMKLFFTALTIGAGYKGGEVTPLFFIGATLGSTLSLWLPMDTALLAGLGLVGVFAGATHTPIACILMGIELFGGQVAFYLAIVCFLAHKLTGSKSIYSAQD